jgi:hypothetical protein
MESQINLQDHSCCHGGCPDYGKRGLGNIVIKERYKKNDRALLKMIDRELNTYFF